MGAGSRVDRPEAREPREARTRAAAGEALAGRRPPGSAPGLRGPRRNFSLEAPGARGRAMPLGHARPRSTAPARPPSILFSPHRVHSHTLK